MKLHDFTDMYFVLKGKPQSYVMMKRSDCVSLIHGMDPHLRFELGIGDVLQFKGGDDAPEYELVYISQSAEKCLKFIEDQNDTTHSVIEKVVEEFSKDLTEQMDEIVNLVVLMRHHTLNTDDLGVRPKTALQVIREKLEKAREDEMIQPMRALVETQMAPTKSRMEKIRRSLIKGLVQDIGK